MRAKASDVGKVWDFYFDDIGDILRNYEKASRYRRGNIKCRGFVNDVCLREIGQENEGFRWELLDDEDNTIEGKSYNKGEIGMVLRSDPSRKYGIRFSVGERSNTSLLDIVEIRKGKWDYGSPGWNDGNDDDDDDPVLVPMGPKEGGNSKEWN